MKRNLHHLAPLLVVGALGSLLVVACGDKNTNITSNGGGASGAAGSAGAHGGASGSGGSGGASGAAGDGGSSGSAGSAGAQGGAAGASGNAGSAGDGGSAGAQGGAAGSAGSAGDGGSAGAAGSAGGESVEAIFSGPAADHTCALLTGGRLRCWGRNSHGQLGYGNKENIGDNETPKSAGDIDVGGKVVSAALGQSHTCAIVEGNKLYCWGNNEYGQLGYGNTQSVGDTPTNTPAMVGPVQLGANLPKILQVTAGVDHTCIVLEGGKLRCWGRSETGKLGYPNSPNIGDDETAAAAGDISVGGKVVQVAAGWRHTCTRWDTGKISCWGLGLNGTTGQGNQDTIGDDEQPSSVEPLKLGAAAAGLTQSCALLTSGDVRCWGYGEEGRLGQGNKQHVGDDETPDSVPAVAIGAKAKGLAQGGNHVCIVTESDTVRCWGRNEDGQLGYGNTNPIGDDEPPIQMDVEVGGAVKQLVAGGSHTCALLVSGEVRCWGFANLGALGYGNTVKVGSTAAPAAYGSIDIL